jgi:hypothetical protein
VFQAGDKVRCVNDFKNMRNGERFDLIRENEEYIIDRIDKGSYGTFVVLVGVKASYGPAGWVPERFRKAVDKSSNVRASYEAFIKNLKGLETTKELETACMK